MGGFVSRCAVFQGTPECSPNISPLHVDIRSAIYGVPDASHTVASLILSHTFDPLGVRYESVRPNLLLEPGHYFALFAPSSNGDGGGLLHNTGLGGYQAGRVELGFLNPLTGEANVQGFGHAAVRVIGETQGTVPVPDMLWPTLLGLIGIVFWVKRRQELCTRCTHAHLVSVLLLLLTSG